MNKLCTLLLVAALLTIAHAQDDLKVQPVGAAQTRVGEAVVVNVEDELFEEALEWSKKVYQQSNFVGTAGPLDKISEDERYQATQQIVSGILYTFYWSTSSGSTVSIKVHLVPWKQGDERFPSIENQITLVE
jgi:hypothetical protein